MLAKVESKGLECFDFERKRWEVQKFLNSHIVYSNARCVYCPQNKIFVVGGITVFNRGVKDVLEWDLEEDYSEECVPSLVKRADMVVGRGRFGLCANEQFLYVAGGCTLYDRVQTDSVERYTIATDSWETLPPLTRAKNSLVLFEVGSEHLYGIGGYTSDLAVRSDIEYFNTRSGEHWERIDVEMQSRNEMSARLSVGQILVGT